MREIFFFLSFFYPLSFCQKEDRFQNSPAPAKPVTGSWIYLAMLLLGRRFNEKPSPAVTPHLAQKRAVLVCFNRPTPPFAFCTVEAFQRREKNDWQTIIVF